MNDVNTSVLIENIKEDLQEVLNKEFLYKKNNKRTRNSIKKLISEILIWKYNIPNTNIKTDAKTMFASKSMWKRIFFWLTYKINIAKYFYKEDWFSILIVNSYIIQDKIEVILNIPLHYKE